MTYAGSRPMHDADSHIMETPGWLAQYCDAELRERLLEIDISTVAPGESERIARFEADHRDPAYRADDESQLLLRKNWSATGSFLKEDRPGALDLLGFASQLVFNTFANSTLVKAEHSGDMTLAYGMAEAHNRAILDFCSVDPRLLPVLYTPLADFEMSLDTTKRAIENGAAALMIPHACPPGHSPSHSGLEGVFSMCADAGVPVVLHVGGGGKLLDQAYFENGRAPVKDFHGGDGNFKSIDYLSIPVPVMQTLAALVVDGVLLRNPNLRIGVIELGASWFPGFIRNLDSAWNAFRKNEERLQQLEDKPSAYCLNQMRITPYPHEDAGWIIENSSEEVCMFSSDFPHVEGGRNPLGRFDRSLKNCSGRAKDRFYWDNFVDMMGPQLERRGLPVIAAA